MSSMSTSIDDLPGPNPDNSDFSSTPSDNLIVQPTDSNIKVNVKKRVSFADEQEEESVFSAFKNEINEENIILFVLLLAAAMPSLTEYVKQTPLLGTYTTTDFITSLIKAILLIIVYIIFKLFILPKIKL